MAKKYGEEIVFRARLRRTAERLRFEKLLPMLAVFRSAKNQVAMSLRFERDEFGDNFVLPVSE